MTDGVDDQVAIIPTAEENKQQALSLLSETDWAVLPDVQIQSSLFTPYLLNKQEFIVYRSYLRQIAVNPEPGFLFWPTKPEEKWGT